MNGFTHTACVLAYSHHGWLARLALWISQWVTLEK